MTEVSELPVLLVWDTWDGVEFYLISDAPAWLRTAANCYLGVDCEPEQEAALNRISDALCEKLAYCEDQGDPLATQWVKYKIDLSTSFDVPACTVVRCGCT